MNRFLPGMPAAISAPFVGRREELDRIRRAFEAREGKVFYITGPGGIGKTRLLQEILDEFAREGNCTVAREPVDLYHPVNRSMEGLLEAVRVSTGLELRRYQEVKGELEKLVLEAGAAFREIEEKRRELARAFLEDWEKESRGRFIVVAFDTLEKLHYESDRFQELLKAEIEYPVVRSWLFREFLPGASRALILLAGRPRETLARELREILGDRLVEITLGSFSEKETLEYFKAIIGQLAPESIERQRLEKLPEETLRVINLLTGGRPILISLVADYLATADLLLPIFIKPPEEIKELESIREQVERALINQIMELPDPLRTTVYYLAWTRRGMEAELLAKLMDASKEDAEGRLQEARRLSFVKTRPGDGRVFLHDEMYDLMDKHLLSSCTPEERKRIYMGCVDYFQGKIRSSQEKLARLYQGKKMLSKLTEGRRELVEAKAALVHYSLMLNPAEGFFSYFKFAEEAYHGADIEADMLLREEILDFLSLRFAGDEEEIDGLKRAEVETELATRWVKRYINLGRFNEALGLADKIEDTAREQLEAFPLLQADLNISRAFAKIMMWQEPGEVESILRNTIEKLEAFRKDLGYLLLAKAHNYLGYLYRVQGKYKGAIESYNEAIAYQRLLKLEAQQAETLNNSAFALAEAGEPHTAMAQGQDAMKLRLKIGLPYPIGLSYNTMALVEMRHSDYERAKNYAEEAAKLFGEIGNRRGVGLAYIALAEALTRLSAKPALRPEDASLDRRIELLKEAENYAREALNIFQNLYPEEEREIEALLRLGCACRDQARLLHDEGLSEESEKKAEEAREAFRKVEERAREKMLYRAVEAIVDEAWLEYYMGKNEEAKEKAEEAEVLIPEDYRLTEKLLEKYEEFSRTACLPFWAQLGKIQMLRGVMAFDEFEDGKDPGKLKEAVEHFARGLAYNELVSEHAHGFHLALFTAYDRLKGLNVEEIKTVYEALNELGGEEGALKLGRERLRLWDKMEKWFGAYEVYKEL